MREIKYDILKAVALYCVILGHLWPMEYSLRVGLYIAHMPVFFFVSGYFSHESLLKTNGGRTFIFNKIRTVLVPYISWSAIYFIGKIIMYRNFSFESAVDLFKNIFYEGDAYWFLCSLFLCFVLIFIIESLLRLFDKSNMVILIAIMIYFFFALIVPNSFFSSFSVKVYFPVFFVGYYLKKKNVDLFTNIHFINAFFIITIYILLSIFIFNYSDFYRFRNFDVYSLSDSINFILHYLYCFTGVFFMMAITYLIYRFCPFKEIIASFGRVTLDIYVIHILFITILKDFLYSSFPSIIVILTAPLLSVIIYLLLFVIVTKVFRRNHIYNVLFA